MSELTRERLAQWRAEFSGRTPRPEEWPDADEMRALLDELERLREGVTQVLRDYEHLPAVHDKLTRLLYEGADQ